MVDHTVTTDSGGVTVEVERTTTGTTARVKVVVPVLPGEAFVNASDLAQAIAVQALVQLRATLAAEGFTLGKDAK